MHKEAQLDHARAVRDKWVDRYLLKELSPAEGEEFERHFFECQECAEAVEAGDLFIVNAREVLGEVSRQAARPTFWEKFGIRWTWGGMLMPATSLALAAVAVYQGAVVIPQLNSPREVLAFQLNGASRGDATVIDIAAGATAIALSVDPPPDARLPRYLCDFQAGGKSLFTVTAAAPAPGQPITILVPVKGLAAGSYQLILRAPDSGRNISTFSFETRFR